MSVIAIRQKLHNYYPGIAGDDKLKALCVIMRQEIEGSATDYTPELFAEPDRCYGQYLSNKKDVMTATKSNARIEKIINDAKANHA